MFDYAFKEYALRWAFKHPTPADFFRTMEDASSVDLDWFWRGWFYSTDYVDMSLAEVKWFQIDTQDPAVENPIAKNIDDMEPADISIDRDQTQIPKTRLENDPSLHDFYTERDIYEVKAVDQADFDKYMSKLDDEEKAVVSSGKNY